MKKSSLPSRLHRGKPPVLGDTCHFPCRPPKGTTYTWYCPDSVEWYATYRPLRERRAAPHPSGRHLDTWPLHRGRTAYRARDTPRPCRPQQWKRQVRSAKFQSRRKSHTKSSRRMDLCCTCNRRRYSRPCNPSTDPTSGSPAIHPTRCTRPFRLLKLNSAEWIPKEAGRHQPWNIISCLWQSSRVRDSGPTRSKAW